MTVWTRHDMTRAEREAVAEILAAPWPWQPYPGCATCAEHAEALEWCRAWNGRVYAKAKKGGA